MDLERYRTLIYIVETGNLTKAAERLNYTVSGVSRMIAAMEKEMGFPLLIRSHTGVTPTKECQSMLPFIRKFIFAGDACLQASARLRNLETGTLTIGTAYSAYYSLLSKIIADFKKEHPNIVIEIRNGYSTELLESMTNHEIDLCLISKREGNFDWLPLCEDEIVAWVPADSPLAGCETVPLEAFAAEPYINILPDAEGDSDNTRIFRKYHITPNTQFTVTDSLSACSMAECGLGIAMNNAMNSHNLNAGIKIIPVSPRQTIGIGIASPKECSPVVNTFLSSCASIFQKNNNRKCTMPL